MRLTQISIGGFQSFRETRTITLHPALTLIAGRNDVGKSALLRALRLSKEDQGGWATGGVALGHVWTSSATELSTALDQAHRATGGGNTGLGDVRAAIERVGGEVSVKVDYARDNSSEHLGLASLPMERLEIEAIGAEFSSSAGRWTRGQFSGTSIAKQALEHLVRVQAGRVSYVLPRRPLIGVQPISYSGSLNADASNLTSVVHRLHIEEREGAFSALERFITSAFPSIRVVGIRLQKVEGGAPAGELQVTYRDGRTVLLSQCGTGIEQLLALGTAVLTEAEPRLILVDEPSSFLHPAAERVLMDFLREYNHHQYVIATHSSAFLNAFPFAQARLLSLDDQQRTTVTTPEGVVEVLEEVGLRAGDLWLHPRRIWVEGDSEIAAANALVAEGAIDRESLGTLQVLPNLGRLLSKPEAQFKMVDAIAGAVSDVPTQQRFVLDVDEKKPAEISRIQDAAGDTVVFLAVREIENCFLCPAALGVRLRSLTGTSTPTDEQVQAALDLLIARTDDRALYPAGPPPSGRTHFESVKGSAVLEWLYWEFAKAPFQKPVEAGILAGLVWEHDPGLLKPFLEALVPDGGLSSSPARPADLGFLEFVRRACGLPEVVDEEVWRRIGELNEEQRTQIEVAFRSAVGRHPLSDGQSPTTPNPSPE